MFEAGGLPVELCMMGNSMCRRLCRFVFCRWNGLLPLRFTPIMPSAVSAYVSRFAAAGDVKVTSRDMRAGMSFSRISRAKTTEGTSGDPLAICLGGQWSANCNTYANDYLHPGYFCAMFGDLVCFPACVPRRLPRAVPKGWCTGPSCLVLTCR